MGLNMEEKIPVKNLCNWSLSFSRIDGVGDILFPANTTMRLSRGEVVSQAQSNNVLFAGTDSFGSHARVFIDDKDTRIYLDFESEDGKKKQNIISIDRIKEAFALKTKAAFEKAISEMVVTNAEKAIIIDAIPKLKINEYDKIKFVEELTGMNVK